MGTPDYPDSLKLEEGGRIAVIGGGPAGSFFANFLLDMADRTGLQIELDIFEPKDFMAKGPAGCNNCGGIISESLVQMLAVEGIQLPPSVVRMGIDSYVLHMDEETVRINTPLQDKRIATVYRGAGPHKWTGPPRQGLDGYLLALAEKKGARVIHQRVTQIDWCEERPTIKGKDGIPQAYDLLVVAVGVNAASLKLFQSVELDYEPPRSTKTAIREYELGREVVEKYLGSSMHVFLLNLPRLEFAAIIPKDDCVTICMLGEDIDTELMNTFFNTPAVKRCFPPDWRCDEIACRCLPHMYAKEAAHPFGDRIVFIGDSGVSRLYKDGIGAAYRTAKAAAVTAVFYGVSAADFRRHYWPACKSIVTDNRIGGLLFGVSGCLQKSRLAHRLIARMVMGEQARDGRRRRMSTVLWDMFTGSAPYREILKRTLHPLFLISLFGNALMSLWPSKKPVH